MSTNLNYKQVANVSRRTWDTEAFEKRAKERTKNLNSSERKKEDASLGPGVKRALGEDDSTKEEFMPAEKGAAGPHMSKRAFLKARKNKVDVDSKIGSVEIVNPEAAATTKANAGEPGSVKVRIIIFCATGYGFGVTYQFSFSLGWCNQNRDRLAL